MRIQGNRPESLGQGGPVAGSKGAEGATHSATSSRSKGSEGVTRDTQAIHDMARALAKRMSEAPIDERPGSADRARELLEQPFDKAKARQTALRLLGGERTPGPGQSLQGG